MEFSLKLKFREIIDLKLGVDSNICARGKGKNFYCVSMNADPLIVADG